MSRLRLLSASLLAAVAIVACGGGGDGASTDQSAGDGAGATAILDRTFSPHPEVDSGVIDFALTVDVARKGQAGAGFGLELKGPFESPDQGTPSFDLAATGSLENADRAAPGATSVSGSLISTGDAGYVTSDGNPSVAGNYEMDPSLYALLADLLRGIQGTGSVVANPVVEADTKVEGAATTHVSGDLNVGQLAASLDLLASNTGDLGFGLDPGSELPSGAVGQIAQRVKSAQVDVYTGKDGGLLRRLTLEATLKGLSVQRIDVTIDSTISAVNSPQRIEAPPNAKPLRSLPDGYGKLLAALG